MLSATPLGFRSPLCKIGQPWLGTSKRNSKKGRRGRGGLGKQQQTKLCSSPGELLHPRKTLFATHSERDWEVLWREVK